MNFSNECDNCVDLNENEKMLNMCDCYDEKIFVFVFDLSFMLGTVLSPFLETILE